MKRMNATLWIALGCAALAASGCGTPAPVPDMQGAPVQDVSSIARPPLTRTPGDSAARSLNDYKVEIANWLYQGNANQIFSGTPPHELRSVIVLNIVLDASGAVKSVVVFRDNGDPDTRNAAVASVHRGTPYPRPARALLRGGQVQFTETWLFRDDAQFQLRTLAEAYQK